MHIDDPGPSAPQPASASRRHAAEHTPSEWASEAVLDRASWRERAASIHAPGVPTVLERRVDAPVPRRIARAVGVPALAGAVAFAIAVVIAIALTMLQLRPAAEAAEEITRDIAAASSTDGGANGGPEGGSESGDDGRVEGSADGADRAAGALPVLVHVAGEVAHPGVVELSSGARVAEAIEAAGGASEGAVLSAVNLARPVVDGEQILVPDAEQAAGGVPVSIPGGPAAGGAASGAVPGAAAGGAPVAGGAPLDLNTADAAALEALPRVGPALAQRIIDWRAANGRFASVDQLLEVSGIGAKTLEGFRGLVTVR